MGTTLPESGARATRSWSVPEPVALALLAFVVRWLGRTPPVVFIDIVENFRLVRDCLGRGHCTAMGMGTSFQDLVHGALLVHLFEACRLAHLSLGGIQVVLALLTAASVGALDLLLVRHGARFLAQPFQRSERLAAVTLYLLATGMWFGIDRLWNPEPLPLPAVLLHLALVALAVEGTTLAAAAAGAALGLAIDAYLVCLLLGPPFVVLVVALARRPVRALAVAAVAAGGVLLVDSPGMLRLDLAIAAAHGATVPAVAGAALVVAFALVARRRLATLSAAWRCRLAFYGPSLGFLPAIWIGCAFRRDTGYGNSTKYLVPIFAPLAVAAVEAVLLAARSVGARPRLQAALRALPFAAVLLLLLGHTVFEQLAYRTSSRPRGDQIERVAQELCREGESVGSLCTRLGGDAGPLLFGTLSLLWPPACAPSRGVDGSVLVFPVARASRADLPADWPIVDGGGRTALAVVRIRSFVDLARVTTCAVVEGARRCTEHDLARGEPGRDCTELRETQFWQLGTSPPAEFVLPLRIPPGERAHVIRAGERWQIRDVAGVPHRGALPANEVLLDGAPGTSGSISFVPRPGGDSNGQLGLIPDFVELPEDVARRVPPAPPSLIPD